MENKEVISNANKKEKKRELFWDIVKGIEIISIVIGHTTPKLTLIKFVYMYHLIIFYFVSACFYNESKYGDKPFEYFGKRLKSTWPKYVFYAVLLILLHNTFIKYNFYNPATPLYTKKEEKLVMILNTMMFSSNELFAGALWFIPTLLFALGMFGGIIYFSRKFTDFICNKIEKTNKIKKYIKYAIIIGLSVLGGYIGVFLNENELSLLYHIHTSFLVVPICTLGYFAREFIGILKKAKKLYITIPVFIISTATLLFFVIKEKFQIELSAEMIVNGYMFYIISFVGICFCLSFAAIIEKIPIVNKIIAAFGRHSFTVMALHFVCIKGIDVVYSKIINETNPEIISQWVSSYKDKLWIWYVILGVIIPVVFSIILDKLKALGGKNEQITN